MKKIQIASVLVALITLGAQTVSAQSVYSAYGYAGASSVSCVNLTQTLSYGSRGAQVSTLQAFLANQNFPGSGSWMVTGYFGNATRAAVIDLQQQHGIAQTGIVDGATRAVIYTASCGGVTPYVYGTNYGTTVGTVAPWNAYNNGSTVYPYNNNSGNNYNNTNYTNGINLNITSLSRNTGGSGDAVTIYGTGLDSYNNTVYLGTQAVNSVSSNGTSITFTIPQYVTAGTVNLYVANGRGVSNNLSFTVTSYSYGCGTYYPVSIYNTGYNNCNCGTYNPNPYNSYPYTNTSYNSACQNNYVNNTSAPTVSYLSPSNGAVGTVVTVFGTGLSASGNTVHFGTAIITGLYSADGRSVSFTVPSTLNGYGTQQIGLGSYAVAVTNSNGYTSNDASFTVTSTGTNTSNTLSVSYIAPTAGSVGTTVTIYGQGFTPDSIVHFGNGAIVNPIISNVYGIACTNSPTCQSGIMQSITFAVPTYLSAYCAANVACPQYAQMVTPGSYAVTVSNVNGTSNTNTFQVQ